MEAEEFLELVWGDRTAWVDLPAKVGSYWVPWHYKWEGEATTAVSRRIDTCLRDGESLYFSVATFRKRGRNIDDTLPTHWLWADLDETPPQEASKMGLLPTVAWESSPGRYQALWRLNKRLSPKSQAKLNQALSYHLGADHGGWDLTQVLRLPGTRNFKYPEAPMVRLLWCEESRHYDPHSIWSIVRESYPSSGGSDVSAGGVVLRKPLPARARALLRVPADSVVEGERSSRLWELECLLAEAGWGEDEIYAVVVDSAWNKWAAIATGERRLRTEIRKAIHHVRRRAALGDRVSDDTATAVREGSESESVHVVEEAAPGLPFVRYSSFLAMEMAEPKWLIRDVWTAGSQGIFGGEPKTSKTSLALALALSVASGRPFLDKYPVATPGPVLFVQEENAPWMIQDRLRKLARFYGLIKARDVTERKATRGALGRHSVELSFPTEAPLRLLNNYGLDLTMEEHREALWQEVADVRPALIVMDPLYLIFAGVNYDKAHELAPYLKWILNLRNEFNCAVVLIHHFRKQQQNGAVGVRAGQRLMGNATLHGFVDSALYASTLEVDRAGWVGARVEREFRSMAPQEALEVELTFGSPGDLEMDARVRSYDLDAAIAKIVAEDPGVTLNAVVEAIGADKRVVLGRGRDMGLVLVGGKRGRGHSWQMYPAGYETNGAVVTTSPGGDEEEE